MALRNSQFIIIDDHDDKAVLKKKKIAVGVSFISLQTQQFLMRKIKS